MELARCEYIQRRENVIAVGNSGTGKTHMTPPVTGTVTLATLVDAQEGTG